MDIDNANCKVRVSECTDMESYSIERPLKIDKEITGLEKLIEELHMVFSNDHVNVQDVQKLMAGYRSDPKDWRKYAKFDRFRERSCETKQSLYYENNMTLMICGENLCRKTIPQLDCSREDIPLAPHSARRYFRYTRNLVDAGNGAFNIMILCWGAGHASAIHDHADSHCFMKLLSGSLEEVRYDWPENVEPEVRKIHKTNKPVRRCCSESEDFDSDCQNGNCQNRRTNSCHENGDQNGNHNGSHANGGFENGSQNGYENGSQDGGKNGGGYSNEMVEIGRTRLELNDVCYINDALGLHRMENPSHVDAAISLHLYSPPFSSCRVFDARTGAPTSVSVTFTSMYGKKVKRVIEAVNVADSQ